jgi:hypothetical protein
MASWEIYEPTSGETRGPFTEDWVVDAIGKGLKRDSLIRPVGTEDWKGLRSHAPFAMALEAAGNASAAPAVAPTRSPPATPWTIRSLGIAGGGAAVLAVVVIVALSRRAPPVVAERPAVDAPAPVPCAAPPEAMASPPAPGPLDVIRTKMTMADALIVAAPLMVDEPEETSAGTLLFTAWSVDKLRWTDLAAAEHHDETTYGRVQKDVDKERMKRMCVHGSVIEIHAKKTDSGNFFVGLMQNYSGNLFHFYAVGSTDRVVEGVSAMFCGVVTGWYNYKNSGGGTGHAVEIVGMFPLPENRALK